MMMMKGSGGSEECRGTTPGPSPSTQGYDEGGRDAAVQGGGRESPGWDRGTSCPRIGYPSYIHTPPLFIVPQRGTWCCVDYEVAGLSTGSCMT